MARTTRRDAYARSVDTDEEWDGLGAPNCPVDLTPMDAVGEAEDGSDARWVCPVCGRVSIAE